MITVADLRKEASIFTGRLHSTGRKILEAIARREKKIGCVRRTPHSLPRSERQGREEEVDTTGISAGSRIVPTEISSIGKKKACNARVSQNSTASIAIDSTFHANTHKNMRPTCMRHIIFTRWSFDIKKNPRRIKRTISLLPNQNLAGTPTRLRVHRIMPTFQPTAVARTTDSSFHLPSLFQTHVCRIYVRNHYVFHVQVTATPGREKIKTRVRHKKCTARR